MNRRGSALAVVLFIMALLLGLSAVAASQARVRWLAGARALVGSRLEVLAEERLEQTVSGWDPQLASRLPIGAMTVWPAAGALPTGYQMEDSLRRLGALLYERRLALSLRSMDGSFLLGRMARQELVQLTAPALPDSGAVHVGAGLVLESGALLDGADAVPAGWGASCPAPGVAKAGVRLGPGASVSGSCAGGPCLSGAPPQATDSSLPAALGVAGGWYRLAPDADRQASGIVLGPAPATLPGGSCDRSQPLNWGDPSDPASACGDYFPLILVQPGTTIRDGSGQGILLALGSLTLAGSLRFEGVVLAQGSVEIRDGVQFDGTVIARDTVRISDATRVRWSRCAFDRSRAGAAQPARVAGWSGSRLP